MKIFKEIYRKESGQAFVLVLILLLVGMLIIAPLLAFMSTGLISARSIDEKTDEVYAADAGVEDAINKIINDDAFISTFVEGASASYTLTDPVNGETTLVTIYKNSLLENLLGEDEYKEDRVHESWIQLEEPTPPLPTGEGFEYSYEVNFLFEGNGSRLLESVGVFFAPISGDIDSITGPYEWLGTETGVMHFNDLVVDHPEKKTVGGGFAFIWRWVSTPHQGPVFDNTKIGENEGSFSFKFTVADAEWSPSIYFIFGTVKEEDISYITNSPGYYEWLIEATAGDTTVRSAIIEDNGFVDILTWEIDPPA